VTDAGYLKNPMGGLPFPGSPANMPDPLWMSSSAPQALPFNTAGLPATIFARAVWRSPIFDLRPDFRGVMGGRSPGQAYLSNRADPSAGPTARTATVRRSGTTPIWIPRGAAGKLWLQIFGIGTQNWSERGLVVIAQEYANINDPNNLPQVTDNQNITTEFVSSELAALATNGLTTRKTSAILKFAPTGEGYPLRFWQVRVTFLYTVNSAALINWPNPGYSFLASYY
jgi:hypothetical protein